MEEYSLTRANIQKTNKTLLQKKSVIPELKAKRDQWTAKVREAEKAETQQHDLDALKGELGWAHVQAKYKVGVELVFQSWLLSFSVGTGNQNQRERQN